MYLNVLSESFILIYICFYNYTVVLIILIKFVKNILQTIKSSCKLQISSFSDLKVL
jgi:hypothetical protein